MGIIAILKKYIGMKLLAEANKTTIGILVFFILLGGIFNLSIKDTPSFKKVSLDYNNSVMFQSSNPVFEDRSKDNTLLKSYLYFRTDNNSKVAKRDSSKQKSLIKKRQNNNSYPQKIEDKVKEGTKQKQQSSKTSNTLSTPTVIPNAKDVIVSNSNAKGTHASVPTSTLAFIPTNSPIPTTVPTVTLVPTSTPTPAPTENNPSEIMNVSLSAESSATPHAEGDLQITVVKNSNGYWDFILSGTFTSLQPQRTYQVWICNINCSSNSNAKFITDSLGNGSISNATINYAQGNDPVKNIKIWEVPPQGEIKSNSTTCYMLSNNSTPCLQAPFSF